MADSYSDIVSKYKDMSVSELGGSLLQRKGEIEEKQRKQGRKDMRMQQALAVLLAGQGLMKNAFKRRQTELTNMQTLDLLNVENDSKEIANLSTILGYKPTGYDSLESFTKEINPATGKPYTASENTNRFFLELDNKEGFIDKISPLIDQQLKFSSDPDMAVTDPRKYNIIQESMAQSVFEKMITDDNHIKFLNGLEDLYVGQGLTRNEILEQSIGLTGKKLEGYKRRKYAKLEAELKNKGLTSSLLDMFKSIGKDSEDQGGINLFKNLKEKDLQNPNLTEVLDTLNLKGLILPSLDEASKAARQSPDRYLNMVNNKKYEPLRLSFTQVTLPELAKEVDNKIAFKKYGLQSYIDKGVMSDLKDDITATPSVEVNFSKRAAALSLRLKSDKSFGLTLFKQANPNASTALQSEFINSLDNDTFRQKFSALLVLKAGSYDPGWFSGYEFIGAEKPLASIGLGNTEEFNENFKTQFGYSPAQAADKIDPLITPMFNVKTGKATQEYLNLSNKSKDNAWYAMAQQILTAPNISEQDKLQTLENFNNTTPNPLNLPVLDYLKVKDQEKIEAMATKISIQEEGDQRYLGATQRQLYTMNKNRIDLLQKDIQNKTITDVDFTGKQKVRDASPKEIRRMENQIESLKQQNQQMILNPKGALGLLNEINRKQTEITNLTNRLPMLKDNLTPARYEQQLDNLRKLQAEADTLQKQYEDFGLDQKQQEEVTQEVEQKTGALDIRKPKAVGEEVMKSAIDAVVDIQGVSDEYKQISKNFLYYVSKAESNYGLNEKTFDTKRDAYGPMQIIESQSLAEIKRRLDPKLAVGEPIRKYNELLKESFDLDLSTVTKKDLEQPLVSAAVARAYFMVAEGSIPTDPEKMADYYVDNYVRYNPKSPTYQEDREKARQNFLRNNNFISGGFKQTVKSLLGR